MKYVNALKKIKKFFHIAGLPYDITVPYTHVVQIGDPVLRTPANLVNKDEISSDFVQKVIKTMRNIAINDNLTGISACQVGVPLSIIAIHISQPILKSLPPEMVSAEKLEPFYPQIFINPKMKVLDFSTTVMSEMCCSIVNASAEVKRHKKISLSGLSERGDQIYFESSDFLARIIQHEMDHLQGIMFTDIMNPKTFKNPLWKEINELNGFVELNYYPKG